MFAKLAMVLLSEYTDQIIVEHEEEQEVYDGDHLLSVEYVSIN